MTKLRKVAAALSGALLWVLLAHLVGISAAVAIPKSYIDVFAPHAHLAFLLADLALIVVPTLIVCAVWTAATLSRSKRGDHRCGTWFFAGALLVWLYYTLNTVALVVSYQDPENMASVAVSALRVAAIPESIWQTPAFVAPWLGMALGALWARRANSSLNRRRPSGAA